MPWQQRIGLVFLPRNTSSACTGSLSSSQFNFQVRVIVFDE
jgi:hypothetical protein